MRGLEGRLLAAGAVAAALAAPACSIKKRTMRSVADALATAGANSMSSDNDPALIRDAAPFSLKLIEMFLAKEPRNAGLLLAAARGFSEYSFAFVELPADRVAEHDNAAAQEMRERAEKLYLRARDYGMRGLELKHPRFAEQLKANAGDAARQLSGPTYP